VETKILGYDLEQERISLGLKQVLPNPWDAIELNFPVGKHLKKKVKKLTNSGAFIELEEGIDGFLHVEDMSWTKRVRNPASVVKEGDEIEVVVIETDKSTRRIRLGMKQLSDDPWKTLANSYPKGSVIEGVITSITDFGIFVRVEGDIEGLVNKAHIAEHGTQEDEETAMKQFHEGDTVKTLVLDVNPGKQRLSLSIREYIRNQQRAELSQYIHNDSEEGTVTLGDMLKNKGNGSFDS